MRCWTGLIRRVAPRLRLRSALALTARSHLSSVRQSLSSATTRRTPRCCWRPRSGSSRAGRRRSSLSSSAAASRGASSGSRWPGPASSTSSSRTPGTGGPPAELAAQGERLGRPAGPDEEITERINVEFVSANPTGPVTAAGGRGAALGDSIARVLEFVGHPVDARVLRQRPRRTDRALRGLDRGADEGRAGSRGRLRGRLRGRARPEPGAGGSRSRAISAPWRAAGWR